MVLASGCGNPDSTPFLLIAIISRSTSMEAGMLWVSIIATGLILLFFIALGRGRDVEPESDAELARQAAQAFTPPRHRQARVLEALPTSQDQQKTWEVDLTIPEIGVPGTASEAQTNAVEKMFGQPLPKPISHEQASLILDCREYAHAMADVFDRGGTPLNEEISTPLIVAFILSDEHLRDYVSSWGRNRFARGTHNEPPRLRRNEHFHKVHQFLSSQLQ